MVLANCIQQPNAYVLQVYVFYMWPLYVSVCLSLPNLFFMGFCSIWLKLQQQIDCQDLSQQAFEIAFSQSPKMSSDSKPQQQRRGAKKDNRVSIFHTNVSLYSRVKSQVKDGLGKVTSLQKIGGQKTCVFVCVSMQCVFRVSKEHCGEPPRDKMLYQ